MTAVAQVVPDVGGQPADLPDCPDSLVRYCPSCGYDLQDPQGFLQEYWVAEDRNFLCWCPACSLLCTVTAPKRITSHEPEH